MSGGADREALRQQMLLRALLGDARPGVVAGWLRGSPQATERGLAAYRANAGALAERALAAAFPTVQQLLGDSAFAALARDFWRHHPPLDGDIALWGAGLAAFVADAESLADEPYLADLARLEWAVHAAERAADAAVPDGLGLLAAGDPACLWCRLAPGTALVPSAHPIVAIWSAHRSTAPDRFAPVREAFARGTGEHALVQRSGWRAQVRAVAAAESAFTAALLAGRPLAPALAAAGASFDFEAWLVAAVQQGLLVAVHDTPPGAVA